ncbi:MAG: hypothetical protein OXH41_06080 [Chloroflexi bacterium]|nr:hypothetical protein [Chloroflexota bacterium]
MCLPKLGLVGLLLGTLVGMTAASAQEPETDTIEVCVAVEQGYATGQWQGHGYVREPLFVNVGSGPRCERYEAHYEVTMRPLESVAPGRWSVGQYQRDLYGRRETITVSLYQNLDDPSLLYVAANETPGRRIVLAGPRHERRAHMAFDVWSEYLSTVRRLAEERRAAAEEAKAEPEPTPAPTPAPEPVILVRLQTSSTSAPVLEIVVEANHHIGRYDLYLAVDVAGFVHPDFNGKAVVPGEPNSSFFGIGDRTWEEVDNAYVKTKHGSFYRYWQCDQLEDVHALDARFDCSVTSERELPDLTDAEDPALWVYLVNEPAAGHDFQVHVRAGKDDLGRVQVFLNGDYSCSMFTTARSLTEADETQRLGCRATSATRWTEGMVDTLFVLATNVPHPIYCQQHNASNEQREVWACDPW